MFPNAKTVYYPPGEVDMADMNRALRLLKEERKKIEAMMSRIQQQLDQIERGEMSPNQAWVSRRTGPIQSLEELRSPHKNYREALRADLLVLRQQLKEIAEEAKLARRNPPAGPQPAQPVVPPRAATVASLNTEIQQGTNDLAKKMALGDEAGTGQILAEIQNKAGEALKLGLGALRANPSKENLTGVIQSIATLQGLGGDDFASTSAWIEVAAATEKRLSSAEETFRKEPTRENMARMLGELGMNHTVGGDAQIKSPGWAPAGNVHHTTATTGPADTLSGLSKKYYGAPGYWDVIYLENLAVIGSDPDKLLRGIVLVIP